MFQEGIKLVSECGLTHFLPKPLSKDFSLLERGVLLVAQFSLTLGPTDCCLPGSSVHGILQARILRKRSKAVIYTESDDLVR